MLRFLLSLLWLGATTAVAAPADSVAAGPTGERAEPLPDELVGVGVTEKLDAQVPLDLRFTDQDGREVRLGDFLDGTRPAILNLMYIRCPMLCGLVGNGLTEAVKQIDHTAGSEYTILSVSIDPTETPQMANVKRQQYLRDYGRPAAAAGWPWLVGDEDAIRSLTDAVGFGFRWNESRQEFAHAAVLVVLTPAGHVSRYLYGVQFDPRTMKLSLLEAADGKTASTLDRILLFCFHYDATTGRYGPAARNLMKVGGLVTVLGLAALVLALRRRERGGSPTPIR